MNGFDEYQSVVMCLLEGWMKVRRAKTWVTWATVVVALCTALALEVGADTAARDYVSGLEGQTLINGRSEDGPIWSYQPIPRILRVRKASSPRDEGCVDPFSLESAYSFTLQDAEPKKLVGTTAVFFVRITTHGWVVEPPYVDGSGATRAYAERGYTPK